MNTRKRLRLGDAISKITKVLHIPHCEKCEQRRLILNEIRILGVKETIRRLKAVGFSKAKEKTNESWSVEEIIKKMENCCDEK